MIQVFKSINVDWLGRRRLFIGISVLLMLAGLGSAMFRQWTSPNGAFNQGVDFKGGTVITAKFNRPTTAEEIRGIMAGQGLSDATIQGVTDRVDTFLIKVPLESVGGDQSQEVELGRKKVRDALNTIGPEREAYEILGTEAVGAVAGAQLRNKAIAVTMAALVGMLVYIAFRFEWSYGAAAVIAVFHDVLVTLGFFSIFQWEISLTVIAALLTLVGASVNDTIVVFDRVRENRRLHRRDSLYKITNDSINQTLSRTVITQGLIILSVLAMVIFGGDVLRGFSLALLIGTIVGTYSSIAVASPIMVWWEQRLEAANKAAALGATPVTTRSTRAGSSKVKTEPLAARTEKHPRRAV